MKKLTDIRNDILKAVQAGDELGAKFAINDLDTYITKRNIKLKTPDAIKSLPNEEEVKTWVEGLPYYGSCTIEYNEGFEEGVAWLKEKL